MARLAKPKKSIWLRVTLGASYLWRHRLTPEQTTALFTMILGIAAVASVWLAIETLKDVHDSASKQLKEVSKQTAAMRGQLSQMARQNRAMEYQLAATLSVEWYAHPVTDAHGNVTKWAVTPRLPNHSATAAIHFIGWDDKQSFPNQSLTPTPVPCERSISTAPAGPIDIAAGAFPSLDSIFLTPQEVDDIKEGRLLYFVWARGEYSDVFHPSARHHFLSTIILSVAEDAGKPIFMFIPMPANCNRSD